MKKILMFLVCFLSFAAFAQSQEEVTVNMDETEARFMEENYEQEMFFQKQEDISQHTSEVTEETIADDEVYDSDIDYND
jgi:hypothetical protein